MYNGEGRVPKACISRVGGLKISHDFITQSNLIMINLIYFINYLNISDMIPSLMSCIGNGTENI